MRNALKVTTPTDREIVITRDFNASRALVWDAMSRPELLKRWLLGPPGWEMTVCEEDARVGGTFRWAWVGPDGASMSMSGVYHEVVPPERCVRTEVFDTGCVPGGGEQRATLVLEDCGETTALTITLLYESREARDGALASGMERGMAAGYDRLDQILDRAAA
ncbi:SRPBCC family protein [Tundrisphaera sp. TA3]|uniref:SRPBCC family protein n=1 Tax=Tundrisphaera sp. TA3 TaxID=3435775 RepID=UPI003EB9AE00